VTAADGITRLAERAARLDAAKRWLPVALLVIASLFSYCGGLSRGKAQAQMDAYENARRALADTIATVRKVSVTDSVAAISSEKKAVASRVVHEAKREAVTVVSDTVLRVDTVLVNVPPPVVDLIRSSDETIRLDSVAYAALSQYAADLHRERDLWKQRAENAEQMLAATKRPRFGLRTGVVLGASAVALLVHFLH
jgi:hypothetical protein